ncbi:MAG: hypothetical protein J6I50_01780 [Clostridia bacterium]|nr:hypothetical protein [Clostridia bacterium]
MQYTLTYLDKQLCYDPETLSLSVSMKDDLPEQSWLWTGDASIILTDGTILSFSAAKCESKPYQTGVADGIRAVYSGFASDKTTYPFTVESFVFFGVTDGSLRVEFRLEGDVPGEISEVQYPPRFAFQNRTGFGYTVLPRMQGTLIPSGEAIRLEAGEIFERDAYIPLFGQIRSAAVGGVGNGYAMIVDTPYDARYAFEDSMIVPRFVPSLGTIGYPRGVRYLFFRNGDFNTVAKLYRSYLSARGQLVTLKEKIAHNPRVAAMIGTPIVHSDIAVHISPKSDYYKPDDPDHNDNYTPFSKRAAQLRALKAAGADRVYLHLDGWGNHGYDNLHPDPFPPHEASGGADGMRKLQKTCTELGYLFGIHDQYRDYYYDAPSFSFDNAIENLDGSHPYCSIWYGGPHSFLCASLAPEYVRRNYNTFEALDIHLDGSYLDVFSVVRLDECFNPNHRMTREQCAAARRECLDILSDRGIIPSSEEVLGCIINSQVLCHHAPFFTSNLGSKEALPVGIPIPLLNLIYHDCVIIPWFGMKTKGGWGIPGSDRGFLWALACGDTIYYNIDETADDIAYGKTALKLHEKVALCDLVSHTFVDNNPRKRKSVFSDGTVVFVDFDNDSFDIQYPDEA